MPRYAALIYGTEPSGEPDPELWGKIMAEYMHFGEVGGAAGVIGGGEAAPADQHGHDHSGHRRRKGRRRDRHRRSVRRDQGSARRLLPARLQGPRRGPQLGGADPGALVRQGRSAPGHRHERDGLIDPLDEIIRIEGGQVLATLIRLTGDIDRAEDALHDAVVVAADVWRRDGVPDKPGAWLTTVARNKELDRIRREARQGTEGSRGVPPAHRRFGIRRGRQPRRPAAAAVHLLPPGAVARVAGRPGAAHDLRIDHCRHRPRLPGSRGHDRPADQPRQGQDRQGPHPVPGSRRTRTARSTSPRAGDGVRSSPPVTTPRSASWAGGSTSPTKRFAWPECSSS